MNLIFAWLLSLRVLFLGLALDCFLFRFSLRAPKSWRAELGNAGTNSETQKLIDSEARKLASECFSALAGIALPPEPAISLQ